MISVQCGRWPDVPHEEIGGRKSLLALCPSDVSTLSELLRSDCVFWRRSWGGAVSDRAVRRKPVVRSGQDVSVYGFHLEGTHPQLRRIKRPLIVAF